MALNFLITINPQFTQHIGINAAPSANSWLNISGGAGERGVLVATTDSSGVDSTSVSATALSGVSTSGIGVRGVSSSSFGVYGSSTSNFGIRGLSTTSYGSHGVSTSGIGAYGQSSSNFGLHGVSTSGIGIFGQSTSNVAVRGDSVSSTGVRAITASTTGTVYALDVVAGVGSGGITSTGHHRHVTSNPPPSGVAYRWQNNGNLVTDIIARFNNSDVLSALDIRGDRSVLFGGGVFMPNMPTSASAAASGQLWVFDRGDGSSDIRRKN